MKTGVILIGGAALAALAYYSYTQYQAQQQILTANAGTAKPATGYTTTHTAEKSKRGVL